MNSLLKGLEQRPKWVTAFIIVCVLAFLAGWGGLMFEYFNERRARDTVLSGLNSLSPSATVTVDGQPRQAAPVLEALRKVQHIDSHHSSPLTPIEVDIRDGNKIITLVVAQDSERPNEYWVYQPGRNYHNDPLGEFIGRTQTEVFRSDLMPRAK
jgi:hypothetical protein